MDPLKFKAQFAVCKAAEAADGKFFVEGYASHGDIDSYADVITAEALAQLSEMLKDIVLLNEHNPESKAGVVRDAKFLEDKNAVWVKAEVMDPERQAEIADGRLNAFSIYAIPSRWEVKSTASEFTVTILEWERAIELSLTSTPVQEKAQILTHYVKAFALEVRAMEEDKMKNMLKSFLDERADAEKDAMTLVIQAAVKKAMVEHQEEIVAAAAEASPAPKAVSSTEEADFLVSQADALEAIVLEGDGQTAVAAVAAELRTRADALREDPDDEDDQASVEETDEEKALRENVEETNEAVKTLAATTTKILEEVSGVKSLIPTSRQEQLPDPEEKTKKKSAWAGKVFPTVGDNDTE